MRADRQRSPWPLPFLLTEATPSAVPSKDSPPTTGGGQQDWKSSLDERISGGSGLPCDLSNRFGDIEVAMVRGLVAVVTMEPARWVGPTRWVEE